MRTLTTALLLSVTLQFVGCGAAPDPQPLLQSLGEIKANMQDILEGLDAGDIEQVDGVMHRENFSVPFDTLKAKAQNSGIPSDAQSALLDAKDKLFAELITIHGVAHGGSIDDLDVETITANIKTALSDLQAAIPAGMSIPEIEIETEHAEHEGHDDGGEGHSEGEADGHDEDDHEHDGDHDEEEQSAE